MSVIEKVDSRHGDGRILPDQTHGSNLGCHDILFIQQNFRALRRGDLKDDLPPVGQPDVVRGIEPTVFQLKYRLLSDGKPQAVKSPGGHAFNLFLCLSVFSFAFHVLPQ